MVYNEKQKIADQLQCITIKYSSLQMDCIKNKIPFPIGLSHSKKLYGEVMYDQIIKNYDQLLEIKQDIDNTLESI